MEATIPSIFDWSSTASANTSIDSIGTNTGMSPANVDNVFRSIAAIIRSSFSSALQSFFAGTAALPVANGGTGATSAASALTALGALDDDYRDLVRVDKSANFTFSNSERGYGILANSASPLVATINPQSSTAINSGATFVIYNAAAPSVTVTRGSGVTLYKNGATTSSDVVIATGGVATLVRWFSDTWTITGAGIS